jgi:Arm DNA-binding domain
MSPRGEGRRTIGAWIEKTPAGRLRICFRWPARRGRRYRITTEYRDTEENRRQIERARDLVGAEIRSGIFDPAKRFPSLFVPRIAIDPVVPSGRSLASRMRAWIAEKEKRKVRASRLRDYRSHLGNYFERAAIGAMEPSAIGRPEAEAFQLWLVSEAGEDGKGVSEKTAANVIRGTLRAFLRDSDLGFRFLDLLRWERCAPTREQNPFSAEERDRILAWFKAKRPFVEYVSLRLRFRGATPSEVRGFRVSDFDRTTSTMRVRRSQHLGQIGSTKTRARERPIWLDDVGAEVATVAGIRKSEELLLIVAEDTLRDNFTKAQKALGIAERSLYQAKHTYATISLLDGESPAIVARNLGISLATLEKHYAAALQKGRTIAQENTARGLETPRKTPRAVSDGASTRNQKRPRRDLNPCYRRERPVSWAGLDDGDVDLVHVVSRLGIEPRTPGLKGRCSTD